MNSTIKAFCERHRLATQVCLGLVLAVGYNVLPTASAPGPVLHPLRWHGQGTAVTNTPDALAYNRTLSQQTGGGVPVSAVAYPESGTEMTPGAWLNITAAGEDSSRLLFEVILNTDPPVPVLGQQPTPRGDAKFQTAKFRLALPGGVAEHTVLLRVTSRAGSGATTVGAPITVVDPREELEREVSQLSKPGGGGYANLDDYVGHTGLIIERAQADFRIHGWGDAGERSYYNAGNSPVGYTASGGIQPLFLDGRRALHVGEVPVLPVPNVSGILLRCEPWVKNFGGPLTDREVATGEYFAALLNAEAGLVGLGNYADLYNAPTTNQTNPPTPLPEIFTRPTGPQACFPRQTVQQFQLPDQLVFETALETVKVAPFLHYGKLQLPEPLPPLPPFDETKFFQDHADTARLFNNQTANLIRPASGDEGDLDQGARHSPDVPRVRVFASIRDTSTKPLVLWTFSDPKCGHTQYAVKINDALVAAVALGNGVYKHTLGSTTVPASVTVEVSDGTFRSMRKVQLQ